MPVSAALSVLRKQMSGNLELWDRNDGNPASFTPKYAVKRR
jgi:hypothetical protein